MKIKETHDKQFDFNKKFNLEVTMEELVILYGVLGMSNNEDLNKFLEENNILYQVDNKADLPVDMYSTLKEEVLKHKLY